MSNPERFYESTIRIRNMIKTRNVSYKINPHITAKLKIFGNILVNPLLFE